MFSQATVVGRMVSDPMQGKSQTTAIANFSVAVVRKFKVNDEMREEVSYIDCVSFGNVAENVLRYAKKGGTVLVNGRLRQEKWQSKDGENRSKLVVQADDFRNLTFKENLNENTKEQNLQHV